jgi:hypothetical protein
MIPVARTPTADIISSSSLIVHLPSISKHHQKPVITGCRVVISKNIDLSSPVSSTVCGLDSESFLADNLEIGARCLFFLVDESNACIRWSLLRRS